MQSLLRGWNFLLQAWKMALADRDLLKPSVYALFAGLAVGAAGALPVVLAALLLDLDSLLGRAMMAVLGALLVFAQYAVTYVFSAMTIYLIFGYLSEGDGRMEKAWEIVRRDWLDILSLAAASTLVTVLRNIVRGKDDHLLRSTLARLIDAVWTQATYLVLPIMVIEDLGLKDSLKRATYIVKNNLLLIGISMVGVNAINGLIGFVFVVLGVVVGLGVALPLISLAGDAVWLIVLAVIAGVLVASVFWMTAAILTSYTATAYHTCLYLWAREVERAGQPAGVPAPAPLAAVLGN